MATLDDAWKQRLDQSETALGTRSEAPITATNSQAEDDLPYAQFFEQMVEGALFLDAEGVVLACNRHMTELLGQGHDALVGTTFEALVFEGDRAVYRTVLYGEAQGAVNVMLMAAYAVAIPARLTLVPLRRDPWRRGVVLVAAIQPEAPPREAQPDERATAARKSDSPLRDSAALGHELRGPLNVILGWAAFLLEQRAQFDAGVQRALEAIERNARLQWRIIEEKIDSVRSRGNQGSHEGASAHGTSSPIKPADEPPIVRAPLSGMRVLIVDADASARELIATFLLRAGAEVTCANEAASALACMAGKPFDGMVCILNRAVWELVRQVRERYGMSLPILALGNATVGEPDPGRDEALPVRGLPRAPMQEQELIRFVQSIVQTR